MNLKKRWIYTGIILITYSVVYFITQRNEIYNFGNNYHIIDVISQVVVIVIFGFLLSLIMSIFPIKKWTYKLKLKKNLPVGILIIAVILLFLLLYTNAFGKQIVVGHYYDSVKTPDGLDCLSVKDGNFKMDNYTYDRSGNIQIQINQSTLEEKIFTVNWVSQCEYILTDTSDITQKTMVKITDVTKNGYTCFVTGDTNNLALRYQIKRQ